MSCEQVCDPMAMKLLVGITALCIASGDTYGDTYDDRSVASDVLFDHGLELYERGDYRAAQAAFSASYHKNADSDALYYLAKTYQRLGQFTRSLQFYEQFLAEAPHDDLYRPDAKRYRTLVARAIATRTVERSVFIPDFETPPLGRIDHVAPATVERQDPRSWRRTLFWVSGAAAVASIGLRIGTQSDQSITVDDVTATTFWAAVGGAAYFYYTGYIRDAPKRDELRVQPTMSREAVGMSLELGF